jgi:hypothetical protein
VATLPRDLFDALDGHFPFDPTIESMKQYPTREGAIEALSRAAGREVVTVAWPSRNNRDEPDPFVSTGRQAQRDAFAARGRFIWWSFGVVVVLVVALAWWCFR